MIKIGFIGAGNMSYAMVSGMLKNNFKAKNIYLSDTNPKALTKIQQQFATQATTTEILVKNCNIIILAVKPQIIKLVCNQIKSVINSKTIIVSIAAGINTKSLQKYLTTNNIIRAMPNTPALVGLSATGIFSLIGQQSLVDEIFKSIGICIWLDNEDKIDIVTAVSGSGPAYFFLLTQYMIEVATNMGLNEKDAQNLAKQTILGSGVIAQNNNLKDLRKRVTSPGGTTEAAIKSFIKDNLKQILENAMHQAKNRAKQLAREN